MTPQAFGGRFPEVAIPSLPFMGACTIDVAALTAAEAALRQGGLLARRDGERLVACFPEELGIGAWEFRAA
jgi:hypothetical protein